VSGADPPESDDPSSADRLAPTAERSRDELFRLLVENVAEYAIFLLGTDGTIASWNAGARRMKGYADDEIIGQHFSIFYTPEDIARDHPAHELEIAAGPAGRYEEEGWRVRQDGSRYWANVLITALRDADGELVGFAKVTRDLTERRRTETQLREIAEELGRSNLELQDFSSAVAHDLRAPVQVIGGFAELLQRRHAEALEGEAAELVARIRANVDLMNDLISGLLSYSLAGRQELALEPVQAADALAAAVQHLGVQIAAREALLEVGSLPALAADRTQLIQVFQNLVANAIKFSTGRPRVAISAAREDRFWHFRVEDDGIGVPPRDAERIFGMFERASDRPGTGVGLATCRRIVERHGGRIWVESEPGSGSTFHFTWPADGTED
jgi:PAS domain S-box-containing protein